MKNKDKQMTINRNILMILFLIFPFYVSGSSKITSQGTFTQTSQQNMEIPNPNLEPEKAKLAKDASDDHANKLTVAKGIESVALHSAISLKIALLAIESAHLATAVGAHAIPWLTALNPVVGGSILAASLATHQLAKQFVDRMVKYVERVRVLQSVIEKSKSKDTENLAYIMKVLNESNKGRVKYRCKDERAVQDAQNQSMRNALFCIYNNPMPMDYLCEFLGHLNLEEPGTIRKEALKIYRSVQQNSIKTVNNSLRDIADFITDPLIEIYRKSLKYRLLDKYYTAINDDFEGLVKIRSRVNIADRLDASEFWHPDAKTNLREILADMKEESNLMKNINLCHQTGCDTIDSAEKDKFIDQPSNKPYQNYCEYYFRKKPLYLMDKLNIKKQFSQKIRDKNSDKGYLERKKQKREKIISKASENLKVLMEEVEQKTIDQVLKDSSDFVTNMDQSLSILQKIQECDSDPSKKEECIQKLKTANENKPAIALLNNIADHLREEKEDNKKSEEKNLNNNQEQSKQDEAGEAND